MPAERGVRSTGASRPPNGTFCPPTATVNAVARYVRLREMLVGSRAWRCCATCTTARLRTPSGERGGPRDPGHVIRVAAVRRDVKRPRPGRFTSRHPRRPRPAAIRRRQLHRGRAPRNARPSATAVTGTGSRSNPRTSGRPGRLQRPRREAGTRAVRPSRATVTCARYGRARPRTSRRHQHVRQRGLSPAQGALEVLQPDRQHPRAAARQPDGSPTRSRATALPADGRAQAAAIASISPTGCEPRKHSVTCRSSGADQPHAFDPGDRGAAATRQLAHHPLAQLERDEQPRPLVAHAAADGAEAVSPRRAAAGAAGASRPWWSGRGCPRGCREAWCGG